MKNKIINLFENKTIVPNNGVKYSELLEQFIAPFVNDLRDTGYLEDILEFAINAWNFGNIKILLPKGEFEKETELIKEKDINVVLLRKMINYKASNFKEYENFIVDYELKEVKAGEEPILSIVTQEKEAYLANMMDSLDNEVTPDDFEENYINRSAIILKPQQPFIDWCSNLNPDDDFEEEIKEANIYLVDDTIDDIEKWLRKKFDTFFRMELDEWHDNKKEWPQKRSYKMFKLWFRVEISEMIYDLEKKPVLKSE
ncbi:MAG: hypothetical protein GY834_05970 [Bacteroidetes bacterium]|nr:hypothetical protein [Bacteroidota bacterium]